MRFFDRREFFQNSTAVAAALAALNGVAPSARAADKAKPTTNGSANDRLRVAVMGVHGRGMEHVHSLLEPSHIEHAKLVLTMDSDFHHARAHLWHRPEIRWRFAALHQVELVAHVRANIRWSRSQPGQAVTQPCDRFQARHFRLYKIGYIPSKAAVSGTASADRMVRSGGRLTGGKSGFHLLDLPSRQSSPSGR